MEVHCHITGICEAAMSSSLFSVNCYQGGGGALTPQKKSKKGGGERDKQSCVYACEAAAFQPFPK